MEVSGSACALTDYNCDDFINMTDFFLFADVFAQFSPPVETRYDLDGSGRVDFPDLFIFAATVTDATVAAKIMVEAQDLLGLTGPYDLLPNYPNPFNSETTIEYAVLRDGPVRILIFDAAGQLIRTLVNREHTSGFYKVTWGGRDDSGGDVGSGVYIYRLQAGSFGQTRKLLLLK